MSYLIPIVNKITKVIVTNFTLVMVVVVIALWSMLACSMAPVAIDTEFDNRDRIVQREKDVLAGYYDYSDLHITKEAFAEANAHANQFLATTYGRSTNEKVK